MCTKRSCGGRVVWLTGPRQAINGDYGDGTMGETDNDHVPVTLERWQHIGGLFFHGTKVAVEAGDELAPATDPASRRAACRTTFLAAC